MADRFKYSEVRQKIIDAIRIDLIGPKEEEEILEENPRYAYLVGMLDIQSDDEDYSGAGEQEVDADMAFEDGEDFTAGEDDDNEPISTTHFQLPSSIGISFYVQSDIESINLDVTWGDYEKSSEKYTGKDEKEHSRAIYKRRPMKETVHIQFKDFTRTKDYQLVCDSNIHVHISRIPLKGGYSLVTAYVINKRKNSVNSAEAIFSRWKLRLMWRMVRLCLSLNTFAGKFSPLMSSILNSVQSWDVAEAVRQYGISRLMVEQHM